MSLITHCRKILEQNLLKADETFVIATPPVYDREFVSAMLQAAGDIGATGAQLVAFPKLSGERWVSGVTDWHWKIYASADLLISLKYGFPRDMPAVTTSYVSKVGKHEFRTDHESISHKGSKTRFLDMGFPIPIQKEYFPTAGRKERTLEAVKIIHKAKEIRVTSKAGTDFVCKKVGRPGHAQYGFSDVPGRWDNFGYGCVLCAPEEESSEGTVVIEPGDILPKVPVYRFATDEAKLTFKGGYVTDFRGGLTARSFSDYIATFNDKEAYGVSHVGWGTHEKATLGDGTPEDLSAYHHNAAGTILFALGANYGHSMGGPEMNYSGMGETRRKSKAHIHFTLRNADFYCDGEKVVANGKLVAP